MAQLIPDGRGLKRQIIEHPSKALDCGDDIRPFIIPARFKERVS